MATRSRRGHPVKPGVISHPAGLGTKTTLSATGGDAAAHASCARRLTPRGVKGTTHSPF